MSYRKKHIKKKIYKLKKSNKKSIIKRPVFWIGLSFLIIFLSLFYLFIFSPKFQLKEIEVSGNEKVRTECIQDFVWLKTAGKVSKSIFLVNHKNLSKEILANFPEIEMVKISKKLFGTLNIEITERKPFGAFCGYSSAENQKEKCFVIDETGIIFKPLPEMSENMLVLRNPLNLKELFTGEKVIAENVMAMISKIKKNMEDDWKINIEEAVISTPTRLDIKTSEKWQIYFNLESDINMQIEKVNLLLNNEISADDRKNLNYIDLRFKDKAYYK